MKRRISPLMMIAARPWFGRVGMVVLLGIVALAVDVGHLYAERRHMQNAADTGALEAAARCFENDTGWRPRPRERHSPRPTIVVPMRSARLRVNLTPQRLAVHRHRHREHPNVFRRVFGIPRSTVAATAKAASAHPR